MDNQTLHEARTNPEFLKFLQQKEDDAIKEQNLVTLYEVLDNLLILDLDQSRINKVYEVILKTAFDLFEKKLDSKTKLDIQTDDLYITRAFYELGIEKWSMQDFEGAKYIFTLLSDMVEDTKLKNAIKVYQIATTKQLDMEEFYETNISSTQLEDDEIYGYFIINFNFNTEEYIQKHINIVG